MGPACGRLLTEFFAARRAQRAASRK
jgi:hypothetical protein